MKSPSAPAPKHVLLIPSYNPGRILLRVVEEALAQITPVWVVIDGSTDGSDSLLEPLRRRHGDALKILRLSRNQGKGCALRRGMQAAYEKGFTHALTMDSDGQHPADMIPEMTRLSAENPEKLILGYPIFDKSAPLERVWFRRVCNWLVRFETRGAHVRDSLFGFRVYPLQPTLHAFSQTRFARRFDVEAELAVRLCRMGIEPFNQSVPVKYLTAAEGGVSHFHYIRDNLWLLWMHLRLLNDLLREGLERKPPACRAVTDEFARDAEAHGRGGSPRETSASGIR